MPTYSEWLTSTTTAFANAMSSAYTNRNTTGNDFYLAWQDMTATSDLNSILPPGSTAFWNTGGPTADEAEVLLFRDWLQDNPVTAGRLGLEPTISFRSDLRTQLGNAGNVGTEKRRWKGSPLYTFANGVLVGKDGNIAAAIGTEGGEDIEGFGTDTITYFDGIPFSTGTGVPGSTVIAGDAVVSGSIRGTGGVVIIPDVIQLEQDDTITSPAGIGVDSDGKIRLRHRGEGFLDLVDEIATAETDATNAAKVFAAAQNTSSGRFGMSLIPNSNFSYKSIDPTTYTETFANIISVGTTSNILSESSPGVGEFEADAGGICFSAFPTTSERYAVRIRFEGDVAETVDDASSQEGLFVTFNETTDDLPDGKYYVFNDANIGPSSGDYQGSEVHTANVSVVTPMLADGGYATTDGGGNIDGLTIPSSMGVSSFLYKPSAGAKNASMVIFAKNFGSGSNRSIRIDYIVLNESPKTTTEIEGIVDLAVTEITGEDDISIVPDKHMADKTQWATRGTSVTLTDTDDGGSPAEDAIQAVFGSGGGGIISSAIQCESDRYLVGCKIKVTNAPSGDPVIEMFSIENNTPSYPTIGGADTSPITSGDEVGINIMKVEAPNYLGTSTPGVTLTDDGNFHTLLGTYETTVTYMDDLGTTYTTYDPSRTPHSATPIQLPSVFSLGIQVDKPCTLLIDYVYGRVQGSSVNIVEGLATAAYTDAEGFVTAMNELVIKESGSIITNSSMGYLNSDGKPSGWATPTDCTLTFDDTGDYAITISRTGSGTRRLITPTFNLGTADKFSVGIRIKSTTSSAITPVIKIASSSESIIPNPYSTIAEDDGGTTNVVYTGNTSIAATLTMSPTSTTAGNYETLLSTWNRTSETEQAFIGGMASVVIECPDDFTVDYVFVKEQTVSYDLADAQAEARRDEAIAQAAGFVADIGDSIAAEAGSLLTNADFTSWYKDGGLQRPQKWLLTRGATLPRRVIRTSEVSSEIYAQDSTSRDAETEDDVNQTGSSIRFSPSSTGGILSAKWQLPITDAAAVSAGTTTTGAYTVSARVKVGSSSVIGVRIYAHESFDYTDASQEHVFCKDGTYGSVTVEGADRTSTGTPLDSLFMFADGVTTGQVTRVGVINISNPNDTTPGYDPNYTNDGVDNDYAEAGDDQYVEYIPLDNNGMGGYEDGDLDGTIENAGLWYDIGGTFKPDGKTKCVSFEILIDGDPDSNGVPTNVYVDYVSLIQQPFDTDFATTLADARVNSLTGISSESFGSSTDPTTGTTNTTLAAAILANQQRIYTVNQTLAAEDESTTLIPNSFFTDHTTNTPNLWLPTRNTNATLTLEDDPTAISNADSYGTYVELGGTNDVRGILSSAIPVIGDGDDTLGLTSGGLTTNPKFDLAIRYKATSTENISFQIIAHEYFDDSYDATTYKYVYANGANYIHPTASNSVVQRYNTGVAGQVQSLNTLLNNGVDTTEETEKETQSADWQTLVGLYEPHASARWVSFEFVIDHDKDNDDILPDVYVDGILLQASQETPLLSSVKQTAETAQTAAGNAQSDATQALSDASDNAVNLAAVELAQSEAAIVRTGIASEQGSILFNAGFSETITSNNKAHPLGFFPFQNTPGLIRITNQTTTGMELFGTQGNQNYASEVFNSPSSIYLDVGQRGSALAVTTTNNASPFSGGFYSRAMPLPKVTASITSLVDGSTSDQDSRGIYSIAVQVRSSQSTGVSVSIKALEYDNNVDTDNYISETFENTYDIYGVKSEWDSPSGSPVTATRVIDVTGTQIDENDTTASDWEIVGASGWTTVAGTYSPTSTAEFVSFAVIFTTDVDDESADTVGDIPDGQTFWSTYNIGSSDRTVRALAYVDYILVTPASVSADLAADLAAGKAYEVQQDLKGDLTTLEDNLGSESDSLMPNGNFLQTFDVGINTYAKNWAVTGTGVTHTNALLGDTSSLGANGTYHAFQNPTSGISGILSKVILNPRSLVTDQSGNVNNFNIGLRVRGLRSENTTTTYSAGSGTPTSIVGTSTGSDYVNTGTIPAFASDTLVGDVNGVNYSYDPQGIDNQINQSNAAWTLSGNASDVGGTVLEFPISSNGKSGFFIGVGATQYATTGASKRGFVISFDQGFAEYRVWTTKRASQSSNWTDHGVMTDGTIKIGDALANGTSGYGNVYSMVIWVAKSSSSYTDTWSSNGVLSIRSYYDPQHTWVSRNADLRTVDAPSGSTTTDETDYSIKVIAHESFEAHEANKAIAHSGTTNGLTVQTPHADNGVTVDTFTSGQSNPLNLIDLRYSLSTPATEVIIKWDEQDGSESITDWRNILGSYTPHEDCTAVSFEIIADMDPPGDDDNYDQYVYIDSCTLAVGSVGADLAQTISDNRIFVEQNFGTAPSVPENNIIRNADFSKSENITISDGSSLKVPSSWVYSNTVNVINNWEQTQFQFSPETPEGSNTRAVRLKFTNEATNKPVTLSSKPFKITSNRYEGRIVFKESPAIAALRANNTTDGVGYYFVCEGTNTNLSSVARAIVWDGYDGYLFPSDNIIDGRQGQPNIALGGKWSTDAGSTYNYGSTYLYNLSYGDTDSAGYYVLYFQWVPAAYDYNGGGSTRYPKDDMWIWASLNMRFRQSTAMYSDSGDKWVDVYEISLVPVGNEFGSWTGSSNAIFGASSYDDEGDIAPDAPREIEAVTSQYNSIDIEVSDTTNGTSARNCLLLSLPRKIYLDDSDLDTTAPNVNSSLGPNTDGVSYYYPGVSDIVYEQYASYPWFDPEGNLGSSQTEHRRLIFPGDGNTELGASIHNVTRIEFGSNYDEQTARFGLYRTAGETDYLKLENLTDLTHNDSNGISRQSQKFTYLWPVQMNVSDTDRHIPTICLEDDYYTGASDRRVSSRCGMAPDYVFGISFYYDRSSADSYNAMLKDDQHRVGYISRSHGGGVISFTGQHRCEDTNDELDIQQVGLIVVSTGEYNNFTTETNHKPTINEALPKVALSFKRNQKTVFGVLSDKEDEGNDREFAQGRFVSILPKNDDVDRLIINSIGEGAVWICNINGNLENGDYITTCEIPGYGMLQDDDLLHNYTVAKITQDCDFDLDNPYYDCVEFEFEGNTYRKAFVGCTYHCG